MFKSDMAPYINLADIQSMVMPLASPADQHRIGESQAGPGARGAGGHYTRTAFSPRHATSCCPCSCRQVCVRDAERVAGRVF